MSAAAAPTRYRVCEGREGKERRKKARKMLRRMIKAARSALFSRQEQQQQQQRKRRRRSWSARLRFGTSSPVQLQLQQRTASCSRLSRVFFFLSLTPSMTASETP